MSNFRTFQSDILSLPGVWQDKNNIYFSQMRDGYQAAYKPHYPHGGLDDMLIQTIDQSGAYLRGNYELIIYSGNKYTSLYFQTIDQLKTYFAGGINND